MVKLSKAYRRRAVYRMYQLGLEENDILKIFVRYDTNALVETLKHFKHIEKNISQELFYAKLNALQGWNDPRNPGYVIKRALEHKLDVPRH